jgi:hypothetical protein
MHIHVAPYVKKRIANHGWSSGGKDETWLVDPIHPNDAKDLELSHGPTYSVEAKRFDSTTGVGYIMTNIGKIKLAIVICCLNIGYAVAELSKFFMHHANVQYITLNRVFHYLRQMKEYGLVYWQNKPHIDLNHVSIKHMRPLEKAEEGMLIVKDVRICVATWMFLQLPSQLSLHWCPRLVP